MSAVGGHFISSLVLRSFSNLYKVPIELDKFFAAIKQHLRSECLVKLSLHLDSIPPFYLFYFKNVIQVNYID